MVRTEAGNEYSSGALLLATGARYRRLNVPGEEDFIGDGIHFCATCDSRFYKRQDLLVVGGGNMTHTPSYGTLIALEILDVVKRISNSPIEAAAGF